MTYALNWLSALILFSFTTIGFAGSAGVPDQAISGVRAQNIKNPREILFIHDMHTTPFAWEPWLKEFRSQGYAVYAPVWPLYNGSIAELRRADRYPGLAQLSLDSVVRRYRQLLSAQKQKPILVGHGVGGLVAQILLSEGLATAAVAIASPPPKTVFESQHSDFNNRWPWMSPFILINRPTQLTFALFKYFYANTRTLGEASAMYKFEYVPGSVLVARGSESAAADFDLRSARGPLLLIGADEDRLMPARLVYENFLAYGQVPTPVEFLQVRQQDHSLTMNYGWKEVAERVHSWLDTNLDK